MKKGDMVRVICFESQHFRRVGVIIEENAKPFDFDVAFYGDQKLDWERDGDWIPYNKEHLELVEEAKS